MRILFIGDVFGKDGRKAISEIVPLLKKDYKIDLAIANAENVSNGKGMRIEHYDQLKAAGIDYFTMGNHTWDNDEIYNIFINHHDIIRPGNINLLVKPDYASFSTMIIKNGLKIRLTNLMGGSLSSKRFTSNSPFLFLEEFIKKMYSNYEIPDLHIIDFHAEYTAEKAALFRAFDGQISAVLGTHTHVQTNDAMVSELNTAFISDIGLTGASDSIIGAKVKPLIDFYMAKEEKMHISSGTGPYQFCAVVLYVDEEKRKITDIRKIFYKEGQEKDFSYLNLANS